MHIGTLSNVGADVMRSLGAAQELFDLLDRRGSVESTLVESGATSVKLINRIDFKNVSFAYPTRPDVPVLRDFSLTVHAGRCVALVGRSGSGKTTVARLLTRLYNIQHGQILFDGVDIRNLNVADLRASIGIVPQEPVLFSGTIYDNIAYGLSSVNRSRVEESAEEANALSFINSFPDG